MQLGYNTNTVKRFLNAHADAIIVACFALLILSADISRHVACFSATAPGAVNTVIAGHPADYFQYVYMIKRGQEGHLLFHNAYTEKNVPDVILQPFYHLAGFAFRLFPFDACIIYHIIRISCLIFLWISLLLMIRRICSSASSRVGAVLLYFSSGWFWIPASLNPFTVTSLGLPYYPFSLFQRFHLLPPHHSAVIAFMMITFLLYIKPGMTTRRLIAIGLLSSVIGLIHPYILYIFLAIMGMETLLAVAYDAAHAVAIIKRFSIILFFAVLTLLCQAFVELYILQNHTIGALVYDQNNFSFSSYILSLGPMVVLALPALWFINWKQSIYRILFLWAYLPLVLYFFQYIHMPVSVYRLFQSHQHIPLAILSMVVLSRAMSRMKQRHTMAILVVIPLFLYGISPFIANTLDFYTPNALPRYCMYIQKPVADLFRFINQSVPKDSVILTPESLGMVMPAYTHLKVIVGHDGNNPQYAIKSSMVRSFYGNALSLESASEFLRSHNVSYGVFGYDAPGFQESGYLSLFEPIYTEGGMTIAKTRR